MQTNPLDIGCSVTNVDAAKTTKPEITQLRDLLYRHRLIVLKDQNLTEAQYCEFARRLGEPVPYLQANYHHPEYPLIFVSSNVKKDGKQIGVARTGGYWHSDTSFEKDPKFITMLMPKVLPQSFPRSTRFIDMAAVYKALPAATKKTLAGRDFMHSGKMRYKVRTQDAGYDIFEILATIDQLCPAVRHPAVIEHPYTGEKVLYGNRGFTLSVADATLDQSARLLKEIFDFAEAPRFVREVRWSMGDVIIWDNRFLAHTSGRNEGPEEETMMYRITLKDGMPLCASQMEKEAA
jgi:(R)-3-[(carboxymethyl)amino]fatty acid dioxygenase/decarboxylase